MKNAPDPLFLSVTLGVVLLGIVVSVLCFSTRSDKTASTSKIEVGQCYNNRALFMPVEVMDVLPLGVVYAAPGDSLRMGYLITSDFNTNFQLADCVNLDGYFDKYKEKHKGDK